MIPGPEAHTKKEYDVLTQAVKCAPECQPQMYACRKAGGGAEGNRRNISRKRAGAGVSI